MRLHRQVRVQGPLLPLTLLLSALPLVRSTACVAGGPAEQVAMAQSCCLDSRGTWYQFYPVQAICVLPDWHTLGYELCVSSVPNSELDNKCIPGDGASLTLSAATKTDTATDGRITFTARA